MSKKIISVVLSVVLLLSCFALYVHAKATDQPLNRNELIASFEKGVGPVSNGYQIDYRYYSPVSKKGEGKYPLVIWLHGMNQGAKDGDQIKENNIAFWASDDFQSRFTGFGGAFIFAPRSLEENLIFWDDSMVIPLKAAIDDFIAKHKENIDLTRIYIGGFSMGGKMTLKMAVAYPEMFAAAFPICPAWALPADYAPCLSEMPIWLVSGQQDPLVNYQLSVVPTWEAIMANHKNPAACRFSSLSKTARPDGSDAPNGHFAWIAVTNDMFSSTNGDYPYMSTVDGLGNPVKLTYPNGMISFLSSYSSDYDGSPSEGSGNLVLDSSNLFSLDTIGKIVELILTFVQKLLHVLDIFFG